MSPVVFSLIAFIVLIASASCAHCIETLILTRKSAATVKAR
ncbi:MAG: hypothetical protein R3C58_06235 [Parvularculaceae bacterium]